jgi:hypothetical protein
MPAVLLARQVTCRILKEGESRSAEVHKAGRTVFLSQEYFNGPKQRYELVAESDYYVTDWTSWRYMTYTSKPPSATVNLSIYDEFFLWIDRADLNWRGYSTARISKMLKAFEAGRNSTPSVKTAAPAPVETPLPRVGDHYRGKYSHRQVQVAAVSNFDVGTVQVRSLADWDRLTSYSLAEFRTLYEPLASGQEKA